MPFNSIQKTQQCQNAEDHAGFGYELHVGWLHEILNRKGFFLKIDQRKVTRYNADGYLLVETMLIVQQMN